MAARDPERATRRIIDAVIVILVIVSGGAYWKAYVDPTPLRLPQFAALTVQPSPPSVFRG